MRVQLPVPWAPGLIFRCIFSCLLEKSQPHITLPRGWGQRRHRHKNQVSLTKGLLPSGLKTGCTRPRSAATIRNVSLLLTACPQFCSVH